MNRRAFLAQTSLALATPLYAKTKPKTQEPEPAKVEPKPKETEKEKENEKALNLFAKSAILIETATGKVLFAKNATEERQVASTQKLMTALLICESGNLERICTVAEPETKLPASKMNLKVGQQYDRRELLKAMLIASANDCAACLARNHAGSEEAFAELMNRRAAQLGMKQSHFVNSNGLKADQHSTAYDMALLARTALLQPVIREIVALKKAIFKHADGKPRTLENTNDLLSRSPYCHGMKTGFIEEAGKCLVSCATLKGRTVISVMLGSDLDHIWKESRLLLHAGLGVQ